MAKQKANATLKSDDSISTVLEEDEELGNSDSENGLRSLLDDAERLLESDAPHCGVNGNIRGKRQDNTSQSATSTPGERNQQGIQESLAAINAPWELRQATALLLQSSLLDESTARLLTSDILELSSDGEAADSSGGNEEGRVQDELDLAHEGNTNHSIGKAIATGRALTDPSSGYNIVCEEKASDDEAMMTESTSLLSMSSSKNEEMLRPSIFTMVHPSSSSLEK